MKTLRLSFALLLFFNLINAQDMHEQDTIPTDQGDLIITFLGHGTLYFTFNDLVIHIDPVNQYADYEKLPKADLIFITHHHGDHLNPETIDAILKTGTEIVFTRKCADIWQSEGMVVKNGDEIKLKGIQVEVVPAYNLVHMRSEGNPFHPKGEGNGYIFNFGETRVYIAGDTENIPEMKELADIDIAFLPMNLPYTMTPEMVTEAVKMFKPKVLYPYHYGNTDIGELLSLMKDFDYCEVRVRDMR